MADDLTGHVNGWWCPTCGQATYGIHLTNGVTPMFLACKAIPDCPGMAHSLMYPWSHQFGHAPGLPEWLAKPGVGVTLEWYKPTKDELSRLDPGSQDHVRSGGLLYRPLTDEGMRLLEAQLNPQTAS